MLNFTEQNLPFALPECFIEFLSKYIKEDGLSAINLRDSEYDPENGGFRPVEVLVEKEGNKATIHYYTEFAYQGHGIYAELGKSNDFDFINRHFASEFTVVNNFGAEFKEVFDMFANSLVSFVNMDAFDEIKVTKL